MLLPIENQLVDNSQCASLICLIKALNTNKHETPIKIIELTDMTVLRALIRQIKEAHWLLSTNWFSIGRSIFY
jgi:hypothetical protein